MNKNKILEKYVPAGTAVKMENNAAVWKVSAGEIQDVCNKLYFEHKIQLKTITATDNRKEKGVFSIFYVFGVPFENIFIVPFIELKDGEEFPSITGDIHEASGYERKIKTFFGLVPAGHPGPRQILLHENWPADKFPLRKDFGWKERPAKANGKYEMQKVKGEGIYEIPVGPVHAGIIEPGHFRFSVAGEEIILLEAKLGYKHKGTEKLFEILPLEEKLRLSERVSGDTSFTHSMAFCQAVEDLADIKLSEKAGYLRVIFSELERLANHFNDIGFMMLDTGFSFGGSNGARFREMMMQWNERLTGSRFLRGVNALGGVTKSINPGDKKALLEDIGKIRKDFTEVIKIAEGSSSVINRLQGTGKIDRQLAVDHGAIGIAGRAVGIEHDARLEYPCAAYGKMKFDIALEEEGDVQARFNVRVKEVYSSMGILEQALNGISAEGELVTGKGIKLRKNSFSIGIAEGWRGEIIYFVATDSEGNISRVDVRDPSFLNWPLVGHAGKGNVVPDFPLINKSFNLSYSGNDL
ncbi:MAG TPA: NADH-quinone oxidoreductase subunit C [Candidatus Paceibacterota bacterium]|nr:NADH-quinone oxidoreductase subunit C [Candidatus Paceibacterota bacterium]